MAKFVSFKLDDVSMGTSASTPQERRVRSVAKNLTGNPNPVGLENWEFVEYRVMGKAARLGKRPKGNGIQCMGCHGWGWVAALVVHPTYGKKVVGVGLAQEHLKLDISDFPKSLIPA